MKKIGRYDIVEELGRGAMGVVYKASDPTIGRLVAIKVLTLTQPTEEGVPGARDIFMREARAAGRLSHPGIVTIHDALEDTETHNNYIVMEFVPGRTLESILLSGPALTTEQALEVICQVGEALDYAHGQQIIHRDLKPANILLTEDGHAKITDFGIAKIAAREGALRTVAIMGTPAYMSPEQVTGGEVDARSDLFSLGILLYLMLTGQKPFGGDTAAVMFKIVYEDPVAPSQVNPQLGPGHDYVVLRCLAKDRNKRYANAREFLDDLDDVQHGQAPRSETKFPITELRTGERTVIARPSLLGPQKETRPVTGRRSKWVFMGVAAALLVVLFTWGILRFRPRQAPSASSPAAQVTPAPAPVSGTAVPATTSAAPSGESSSSSPRQETKADARKRKTTPAAPLAGGTTAASSKAAPTSGVTSTPAPPSAVHAAATTSTTAGKTIQLLCQHELKEATITISSGAHVIFGGNLKGKKKGGFLGIKGGYAGTLSRSITVPAGTRELSVHVVSPDGSVDLSKVISATPPAGPSETLHILASEKRLTLNWGTVSHGTP